MANKRRFKKAVANLANALAEDMLVVYLNTGDNNASKIDGSLIKVMDAADKAIRNSNVFFDKGVKAFDGNKREYNKAKQAYFRALFDKIDTELETEINAALKEFNSAVPKSE